MIDNTDKVGDNTPATLDDMTDNQLADMIFQTKKGLVILEAALMDRLVNPSSKDVAAKVITPKKELIV